MKSLQEIYENYSTPVGDGDKGTLHSYIPIYSELLEKYRKNSNFLEIGVSLGYSMKMWIDYFIESEIIGIELNPQYSNPNCMIKELMEDSRCEIWIADATSDEIIDKIDNRLFDVIIDDGSHMLQDQIKSFLLLKSKMKEGGIYIIEDIENISNSSDVFYSLHNNCEIIDNRHIKGRHDDVLVIYRF
jgi:spermidine synthase